MVSHILVGMHYRPRIYGDLIERHVAEHRQMAFIAGARQVGKTTLCRKLGPVYFNWDNESHRDLVLAGPDAVAKQAGLEELNEHPPVIVFDEIHKYSRWKRFLKGFFDTYESRCRVLVTGSSRLDVYQRGGDSLMGRYFSYHLHPFSVGELAGGWDLEALLQNPRALSEEDWQALLSGFYTPFSKAVDSALAGLRKSIKDMQEETEEVCEKCGKKMVKKWGRNGWFLACPGYPDCKNAKALNGNGTQQVRETGEPCPECGKPLLIREGKRGEFYACSEYPKCKYSKSIGIGINCPKPDCDGQVTALKGKRGKLFYGCTNYPKCDFIAWDEPVVEKCPECGNPFLVRKEYKSKGSVIKCPQKECKYLRPVEPKPDSEKPSE